MPNVIETVIYDGTTVVKPDGTQVTLKPPFTCPVCGTVHRRLALHPLGPKNMTNATHVLYCPATDAEDGVEVKLDV